MCRGKPIWCTRWAVALSESSDCPNLCDASFAPGGGLSRSSIIVLLVNQQSNRASLLVWQSRRQTLTALSAPEAEVVALSEALMPAVVIHEACRDIGLEIDLTHKFSSLLRLTAR